MTDAYSMMKYIHLKDPEKTFYLVCNRTYSKEEGEKPYHDCKKRWLNFSTKKPLPLGSLPEDAAVRKSVIEQVPFTISDPNARISKAIQQIAHRFIRSEKELEQSPVSATYTFLWKLKRIFLGRS